MLVIGLGRFGSALAETLMGQVDRLSPRGDA
jgi:hypothetical protein